MKIFRLWPSEVTYSPMFVEHAIAFRSAIVNDWPRLDLKKQEFDRVRYETFICGLRDRIVAYPGVRITRDRMRRLEQRSLENQLFVLNGDEIVHFDATFYWNEVWDKEIYGWDRLYYITDDPVKKERFVLYKYRAMEYKTQHLSELAGGPLVTYDFSFSREGPFSEEWDLGVRIVGWHPVPVWLLQE